MPMLVYLHVSMFCMHAKFHACKIDNFICVILPQIYAGLTLKCNVVLYTLKCRLLDPQFSIQVFMDFMKRQTFNKTVAISRNPCQFLTHSIMFIIQLGSSHLVYCNIGWCENCKWYQQAVDGFLLISYTLYQL